MSRVSQTDPSTHLWAHNHSLVIAQVSVSSRHILVNDTYGFPQLPLVKCDTLKQYLLTGGKCRDKYIWPLLIVISELTTLSVQIFEYTSFWIQSCSHTRNGNSSLAVAVCWEYYSVIFAFELSACKQSTALLSAHTADRNAKQYKEDKWILCKYTSYSLFNIIRSCCVIYLNLLLSSHFKLLAFSRLPNKS